MHNSAQAGEELAGGFRLGPWTVLPERGQLIRGADIRHIEPKVMAVLLCLARRGDAVVSKQELIDVVWNGRPVSDEVITRCISALRSQLGDDPKSPSYIETLPKLGYRLIGVVQRLDTDDLQASAERKGVFRWPVAGLMALAVIAAWYLATRNATEDLPADSVQSIAVLPFKNMSRQPDDYLCDGITEELIYTLAREPDLRVVARTSSFQFRDHALDVRDIGRQLAVGRIIEGSVRRDGDRIRVTAQLIHADTGYHIWAETLDADVTDVFELQQRVAERVRQNIRTGSGPTTAARVSRPANAQAYDLYLRGRYALNRRSAESLQRAIELFTHSIELDPGFGPAYLELANAYLLMPSYASRSDEEMYDLASEIIETGVRRDPSISRAAAAVSGFVLHKRGDWLAADSAFKSALAADTVSPTTHQWYSHLMGSVGRLNEAFYEAQLARELDPLSPVINSRLAVVDLWLDRDEVARQQFDIANELGIDTQIHAESYLLLLIRLGEFGEARALTHALQRDPGVNADWIDALFECLQYSRSCDGAEAELLRAAHLSKRIRLVAWALLQNSDQTMAVAQTLRTDINAFETELLFIAELDPLRRHPEFPGLLESIGLTEYWKHNGCRWIHPGLECDKT